MPDFVCQAHTWRSLNAPLCKLPIPAERVRRAVLRGKPPLYCSDRCACVEYDVRRLRFHTPRASKRAKENPPNA